MTDAKVADLRDAQTTATREPEDGSVEPCIARGCTPMRQVAQNRNEFPPHEDSDRIDVPSRVSHFVSSRPRGANRPGTSPFLSFSGIAHA